MQKSSVPAVLITYTYIHTYIYIYIYIYSTQLSCYLDASMGSPHMQLIGQALKSNGVRVPRHGQLANTI